MMRHGVSATAVTGDDIGAVLYGGRIGQPALVAQSQLRFLDMFCGMYP